MPTNNRLYDEQAIADNPYQLPVDAPQFDTQPREPVVREPLRLTVNPSNMTPGPPSSAPGEAAQPAYKLTPVDYDPWAESQTHKAETRKTLPQVYEESGSFGKAAMFAAGLPYALGKTLIVDPIRAAANLTNRALSGEHVMNNDPRALSSDVYTAPEEDVGKAMNAAGLAGTGGLAGAPKGAIASGLTRQVSEEAAAAKAPIFYSAVEHAVDNIKQNKAPAEQWLATISNSKGVKPEELDWIGLKDFLSEKKGPVTKTEIQDYINANKVELKEVNKNQNNDMGPISGTKYHSYQLPGGEPNSYREMLMTLPSKKSINTKSKWEDLTKAEQDKVRIAHKDSEADLLPEHYIPDVKEFYETIIVPTAELQNSYTKLDHYKSSHWDESNILAHVRMNDRMIEGKKSLHLEELQSDLHQLGREKGYKNSNISIDDPKFIEWMLDRWGIHKTNKDYVERANALKSEYGAVPNFPFKKTWHELALKRMIRETAEKGYDRLSWTPGEAQAARYNLSKQVETIRASKNSDDTYHLMYQPKGDKNFATLGERVPEKELANNVGKELAEKITKDNFVQKELAAKEYSGLDLKVGGEGMKGFYDKMIPDYLNKIGKEHGVKVKTAELNTGYGDVPQNARYGFQKLNDGTYGVKDLHDNSYPKKGLTKEQAIEEMAKLNGMSKSDKVHYIDIPESLKNVALHKGFPLFSAGLPYSFTPVDNNPFEKKK